MDIDGDGIGDEKTHALELELVHEEWKHFLVKGYLTHIQINIFHTVTTFDSIQQKDIKERKKHTVLQTTGSSEHKQIQFLLCNMLQVASMPPVLESDRTVLESDRILNITQKYR